MEDWERKAEEEREHMAEEGREQDAEALYGDACFHPVCRDEWRKD